MAISCRRTMATFPALAMAMAVSVWAGPHLEEVSFKATHNSYAREDYSPWAQILDYNVWRLEIDFGQPGRGQPLTVGHTYTGNCNAIDCWLCMCPDWGVGFTLQEYLVQIAAAASQVGHPILLQLQANTSCPDEVKAWPGGCDAVWFWPDVNSWDANWQEMLHDNLRSAIGEENILAPSQLQAYRSANPGYLYPTVSELAGKFIIALNVRRAQDYDFVNREDPLMFISDFLDLSRSPGPEFEIDDQYAYFLALKEDRPNRLIMNEAYFMTWSFWGVHPPVPIHVQAAAQPFSYTTGTGSQPCVTVGGAVNMARVVPVLPSEPTQGWPAETVIEMEPGTYPETLTLTQPMTLLAPRGTVTIGGSTVAYTIWLQVADVADAGTWDGCVGITLHGSRGSSAEIPLTAGIAEQGTLVGQMAALPNLGDLQSVTLHVACLNELLPLCVYVDSAAAGRYYFGNPTGLWVGWGTQEYRTFTFSAHWD